MNNKTNTDVKTIRISTTIVIVVLFSLTFRDLYPAVSATQNWMAEFTLTWGLLFIGIFIIGVLAVSWIWLTLWFPKRFKMINWLLIDFRARFKIPLWILAVIVAFIPVKLLLYTPLGTKLPGYAWRSTLFVICIAVIAAIIAKTEENLLSWQAVFKSMLLVGSLFAFAKSLVGVTSHPFSLGWSEGNRLWDYSMLFGRSRYQFPDGVVGTAFSGQGRQALWGLPFLFSGVTIEQIRLWSALVFTIPYILLGWLIFQPQKRLAKPWFWMGLWVFLFLNQGPIYTPLILSAILIAGIRHRPLWIALPLIFLSSYYMHINRITWIFAPTMWAVMIALADIVQVEKDNNFSRHHGYRVFAYGLAGLLGSFGIGGGWERLVSYFKKVSPSSIDISRLNIIDPQTQLGSDRLEDLAQAGFTVTNQPLLWERLWPNPTYGMGIVVSLLVAVGPLIILLIYLACSKRWKLNVWQTTIMLTMLLAFLAVGMVASVKIGGGSNLHNLDMFLIGLVFTAVLAWEAGGHRLMMSLEQQPLILQGLLFLIVAIPVFMPIIGARPLLLPPQDKTDWTLELLQAEVDRVVAEGGEVLFMDQRQLLTFDYIQDVPLVPEYEKKKVMDMAMSADKKYFAAFYGDLAAQRFGLIVTDPQRVRYAEDDEAWGEENDAWVQWVTEPLLCYYQPKYTIKKTHVWLLMPREDISDCSYP